MSFGPILQRVLQAHPQVLAVLFCDEEGELVDLAQAPAASLDPFELRVLGASAAAWLHTLSRVEGCDSDGVRLRLRHRRAQVLLHGLPEHYYLLAVVAGSGPSAAVERSLSAAAQQTRAEM